MPECQPRWWALRVQGPVANGVWPLPLPPGGSSLLPSPAAPLAFVRASLQPGLGPVPHHSHLCLSGPGAVLKPRVVLLRCQGWSSRPGGRHREGSTRSTLEGRSRPVSTGSLGRVLEPLGLGRGQIRVESQPHGRGWGPRAAVCHALPSRKTPRLTQA